MTHYSNGVGAFRESAIFFLSLPLMVRTCYISKYVLLVDVIMYPFFDTCISVIYSVVFGVADHVVAGVISSVVSGEFLMILVVFLVTSLVLFLVITVVFLVLSPALFLVKVELFLVILSLNCDNCGVSELVISSFPKPVCVEEWGAVCP